jgi:hypothetical protein
VKLTDEDRARIRVYLDAAEQNPDHQRFAHLAWAGRDTTLRDVEQWIRKFFLRDRRIEAVGARVCAVCGGRPSGDFMATDGVWAAAGFARRDLACFSCFVDRLGRQPHHDDFVDVPVNGAIRHLLRPPWLVHVDGSYAGKTGGAGLVFCDQRSSRLWIEVLRFECRTSVQAELLAAKRAVELLGAWPGIVVSDCAYVLRRYLPPKHIVLRPLPPNAHADHGLADRLASWARLGYQGARPRGRLPIEGLFSTMFNPPKEP